jgi:hypothetical protein
MPTLDLSGVRSATWLLKFDSQLPHDFFKPANFSPPVCSSTGEAGKNVQTVFFQLICGLPEAFYRDLWSATIVIGRGIYVVNMNFSKIIAFKEIIRKFLNMVAVHGLRQPSQMLIVLTFSCQCPFKLYTV